MMHRYLPVNCEPTRLLKIVLISFGRNMSKKFTVVRNRCRITLHAECFVYCFLSYISKLGF